jgi:hypothetical protein
MKHYVRQMMHKIPLVLIKQTDFCEIFQFNPVRKKLFMMLIINKKPPKSFDFGGLLSICFARQTFSSLFLFFSIQLVSNRTVF